MCGSRPPRLESAAGGRERVISKELASFLESGISILVGTRDARLQPEAARAFGARVGAGGAELTVLVPQAVGAVTAANVRDNGRIAVLFSRPSDHRSIQVTGRVAAIEPGGDAERALVDRYRCELAQTLAAVGLPPRLTLRAAHWPCHAIRLRVEAIYVQTPGPGAGAPLQAPEGGAR